MPRGRRLINTIEIGISTGIIGVECEFLLKIAIRIQSDHGICLIACIITNLHRSELPVTPNK